ncbi:hypothetical protein ABIE44_001529 [Marmoricola sp. OAE513]|uniref:amidohydrolase family protein n=1 Tax=Marmoricola sp. OAE513 TaxID=2817894 RepID=UPI001AE776BB
MIDTHLHLVSFLQRAMSADDVVTALRANGDGLVVFGLPVKKKWAITEPEEPTYYLDDNAPCGSYSLTDVLVADLVAAARELLPEGDRALLAPTICGFDPTDRLAADHVEHLTGRDDCWVGIGEVLLRHDDLTEITYGENARAGHRALDDVLDICRSRGWPFTFHQDASSAGRSGQHEYVGEVRTMLVDHPDTVQVWAHAGASRRIAPEDHVALLADLLEAHRNLHVDLSWVMLDRIVDGGAGEADPAWVDLIEKFPDRFVLGSDAFGSLDGLADNLDRRQRLLDVLPRTVARMLAVENARRLWWSGA